MARLFIGPWHLSNEKVCRVNEQKMENLSTLGYRFWLFPASQSQAPGGQLADTHTLLGVARYLFLLWETAWSTATEAVGL